VGDSQWHLYDIGKDPGETKDLQAAMPEAFAAMQKEYADYAQSHGVLPMPDWYTPARAVTINGLFNYWIPTYGPAQLILLVLLICAYVLWKKKRAAQR
jgi:hypothetical protein